MRQFDKKTGFFRRAWRGEEQFWKVIGIMVVSPFIIGSFMLSRIVSRIITLPPWAQRGYALIMACMFLVPISIGAICAWRCAPNIRWKFAGYVTRAAILSLWIIVGATAITAVWMGQKAQKLVTTLGVSSSCETANLRATNSGEELLLASRKGDLSTVKKSIASGVDIHTREENRPNIGRTALHYAAGCGHTKIIEFLFEHNADINAKADTGYTPLHVAAGLSQMESAEILIQHRANVNATDIRGTPLHAAVIRGDVAMTELLLSKGSAVTAKNGLGETPLHVVSGVLARTEGHNKIVRLLVLKGGDVNARSNSGETPLGRAFIHNNDGIIMTLLENGADPNLPTRNQDYFPPLSEAAYMCSLIQMKTLLARGAFMPEEGDTPLHRASLTGTCTNRQEVLTFLLEHGAKINASNAQGLTPLHMAVDSQAATFLIEHGADVNATSADGRTPLHWAVFTTLEKVKTLLDHGARVNETNTAGETPLHHTDKPEIAALLISHGADVNARDKKGRTPLHRHADYDVSQTISSVLIKNGANVNALTDDGVTPLHLVRSQDVAQLLIDHGADVNAKSRDNLSPLHTVARRGDQIEIIKTLIANGARVGEKDKDGKTPLHIAVAKDSYGYGVQGLIESGADPKAVANDGLTPIALGLNRKIVKITELLQR